MKIKVLNESLFKESIGDIHADAIEAYENRDQEWFDNRSDDELVELGLKCVISDNNPWGAAYDDEVFDAIAKKGNAKEIHRRIYEKSVEDLGHENLLRVYKRHYNDNGDGLTDDELRAKVVDGAIKDMYGDMNEDIEEEPYDCKQCEYDLKVITHNFTDKSGEVKCGFEEEKDFGVDILKQHYKVVEASSDGRGESTWYVISYADPIIDEN